MATCTLLTLPIPIAWATNSTISPNAIMTVYLAGSTTLTSIYSDVNGQNTLNNPLTADSNGRFPEIFLTPGTAVKIKLTDSTGVALPGYPADNVMPTPTSTSYPTITGTAGETLSAGMGAYLSDGSGGKTQGQWYKWDSTNNYSSSLPVIGMVPAAIASGANGSIQLLGTVSGLSVSVGNYYYVSTAGTLSTSPGTNRRLVGFSDSATSLQFIGNPAVSSIWDPTTANVVDVVNGTVAMAHRVYGSTTGPKYIQTSHDGTNGIIDTAASAGLLQLAPTNATSVELGKTLSKYKGISTAGAGLFPIVAQGRQITQNGAVASLCTVTPTVDSSYMVWANVLVTVSTTHSFQVQCTYTDEGNTARTLILALQLVSGAAGTTSNINNSATVPYMAYPIAIRVKANTAVTLLTSGTFTTVTYNVEGFIAQTAYV